MSLKTRRVSIGVVVLVVAGGITVWGMTRSSAEQSTLPEELSVASIKSQMSEGSDQLRQTMRAQEDLTDEQRQELRRNMREAMGSMMTERVDEYYAAAPEEKDAVLDQHIDEFQERMKEWRKRREERRQEQGDDADQERNREEWRERMRGQRGGGTSEQRKSRSESRDPDQMVRRMSYFQALRRRMTERGIEMPGGRGGWGRGGGGPRGGPHGGGG